ncbi:peptide ligase PGM1-related protein [Streptomyces sp. FH025]|uniref:preATP grasp domain-containing protein n=1 Tax=Streptomyces sp. FH025 TaxID=2815937 RepID=UPI001A9DF943|nr:peptide ligase PGM1-related protein [Streptomyces sp. FH025]MBO1416845.1 ATP-grasp domain-containing protein [Streptomyces sp. FH025]
MAKIIIGNQLTEETAEGDRALPAEYLSYLAAVTHRLAWCADAHDILVLPTPPDEEFLAYVWERLGIADTAPAVLVPPPGVRGSSLLYLDRLRDPAFLRQLRTLAQERGADRLYPFYTDAGISELAEYLGLKESTPGHAFLAEGGNELVNSKTFFRTLAAGNGIPVPHGRTVSSPAEADAFIRPLLLAGEPVIVKQDLHGGGYGNEILAPHAGLAGYGAERVTVLDHPQDALAAHLAQAWDRYSNGGRRKVVVEQYLDGSIPIYIELLVADRDVTVVGYGEMRMAPTNNGLVIPPPSGELPSFPGFLAHAERIGQSVRGLGYRGPMSIDAIVVPSGDILFNEFNGRIGGSTHTHRIGERLLGPDHWSDRVLIARSRCGWNSLAQAVETLRENGLDFDPVTRTGVLIAGDSSGTPGPSGQCLIVAKDLPQAQSTEAALIRALALKED